MFKTKDENPPDLTAVLQELKRDIFATLNCIQIGIIEEFDPSDQTATIQLVLKQVKSIQPDGTKILQERSLLAKCPVMVLFGGVSFINLPIEKGDSCIVLFNDREIDEWFEAGGLQTPQTMRAHDLSDGIAIVGIRSLQQSIGNYLANGIRLYRGENSMLDLIDDNIVSLADLFLHNGNMQIAGNLTIDGVMKGNGGIVNIDDNITQTPGKVLKAGNGVSGTFNVVNVLDGIVVGGS